MAFTFKKTNYILIGKENENIEEKKESVSIIPEGMWMKCVNCGDTIYTEDVENNNHICPKCGYNFRIDANHRLEMVLDEESFVEWDKDLKTTNPLQFEGYEEKIAGIQKKTGLSEGIITGEGKIHGQRTAIGVCDSRFLMGSMGEVVGEKIVRMFEKATAEKIPVVIFACSGGACHRRKTSCCVILLLRWRKNAGGHRIPDADGQDIRCV